LSRSGIETKRVVSGDPLAGLDTLRTRPTLAGLLELFDRWGTMEYNLFRLLPQLEFVTREEIQI